MPTLGEIRQGPLIGRKGWNNRYVWAECPECHSFRWVGFYHLKKMGSNFFCKCLGCATKSATNKGRFLSGADHPNWKGGRWMQGGCYFVKISKNDPYASMAKSYGSSKKNRECREHLYIPEHRLIIAKHLNRALSKDEIVHHLNGCKHDNRIENLALVSPKIHDTRSHIKQLRERIVELERRFKNDNGII